MGVIKGTYFRQKKRGGCPPRLNASIQFGYFLTLIKQPFSSHSLPSEKTCTLEVYL